MIQPSVTELYTFENALKKAFPDISQDERVEIARKYIAEVSRARVIIFPGWHEEHGGCDGSHQFCDPEKCYTCGEEMLEVTATASICPHNWSLVQKHLQGMNMEVV